MRVGVYMGGFTPEAGGGYTFQSDILHALIAVAGQSQHEFVLLCDSAAIAEHAGQLEIPQNVYTLQVGRRTTIGQLRSMLKRELPLVNRFIRRPGRIERAAIAGEIEMAWFVGGGGYEVMDLPYIATVWDLAHRSHPWFPEVSAAGAWEGRESSVRRFLQRASYVIVGTEAGKKEVNLFYQVPFERIRKLPHPTPAFALSAAAESSSEKNSETDQEVLKRSGLAENYVVYPAQFWPHKNHVTLLLALKKLREEHGVILQLALIGSDKGNLKHVQNLVASYGLVSQVHFLGFVSQRELVALYRNALALVYPSFYGPENLPPLEAFALGCPVVASDVAGAEEQLGDAAIRVDPSSPGRIAAAILDLAKKPTTRMDLVRKGRQRALSWTGRDFVTKVFEIFDEFEPICHCWTR